MLGRHGRVQASIARLLSRTSPILLTVDRYDDERRWGRQTVGYNSEEAFSRAFKWDHHHSPSHWSAHESLHGDRFGPVIAVRAPTLFERQAHRTASRWPWAARL